MVTGCKCQYPHYIVLIWSLQHDFTKTSSRARVYKGSNKKNKYQLHSGGTGSKVGALGNTAQDTKRRFTMTLSNEKFMQLRDAVRVIHDHPRTNGYARAYTRAFLEGSFDSVQLLYILNNITHLRDLKGETRVKVARGIIKQCSVLKGSIL